MKEFTNNLIIVRKSKKLTQKQVAEALTLHRTAYTRYESKNRCVEPSLNTLRNLCLLFDVSADYLLDLPEGMPYPKR